MKKVLFFLFVLLPALAFGQSSTLLSMARSELQKRGLNESEVLVRLNAEGIDVEHLQPSEYASYQGRILSILDRMEAEKALNVNPIVVADSAAMAVAANNAIEAAAVYAQQIAQTTSDEAAAEEVLNRNQPTVPTGNIYGHSLFTNKSLDVFRTTDGAQAPDSYVLGEGDEVHISIFGSSQTEIHQRIGADGSIQPAGASKIFLKGLTLAQAREAIRTKLSSHFSFRQDQIAVTISTARTLQVSIYGEVAVAGGFTVSALNTAFNALAAAGGPTPKGSIRNIQQLRDGKTHTLDLYAFIMNPDIKTRYDLQNGDVLYVPVADRIVYIDGAVNRPMRYEMVKGETLKDLFNYAGGLTFDATEFVQIERHENGEVRFLEYELDKVTDGSLVVELQDGDSVFVRKANKPMENYVVINGAVYYGGRFDLEKNSSLQKLIEEAQPRYTAKTDFVFIERTRPDETVEFLTVPFPGVNDNPDFQLQGRDIVHVPEQSEYRDVADIEVRGQVREPFTRSFGLNDRITVSQAIEYAGGLRPSVYPVAYITRRNQNNPVKREYLHIDLEREGDTQLQPGDVLQVYDNSTFTNVGEVHVSGSVKSPFATPYDASLTLHDLLTMAGGFEVGAAYDRVEVYRVNINNAEEVKLDQLTVTVDENYNPLDGDFQIQPYDHIVVRMTPNFTTGRAVELNGRVRYPGTYVLKDSKTQLSEVIAMAGGLLDDADSYASLFRTYRNRGIMGLDLRKVMHGNANSMKDPILMAGDVINIVRMENTVAIHETGTRMAQYVPEQFPNSQKLVAWQGRHSAAWYIRHYAGGFQKMADRKSVTVTFPNNQSESTRMLLGFIPSYPTVEPGGVITMQMDEKKLEKSETPKEKIDWKNGLYESLSLLTSVLSIVVLLQRID